MCPCTQQRYTIETVTFWKQPSYSSLLWLLAKKMVATTVAVADQTLSKIKSPPSLLTKCGEMLKWLTSYENREYPFEVNESWRHLKVGPVYLHTAAHVEKTSIHSVPATNLNERSNEVEWNSMKQFEGQMFSLAAPLHRSWARLWVMSGITEDGSLVRVPNKWKSSLNLPGVSRKCLQRPILDSAWTSLTRKPILLWACLLRQMKAFVEIAWCPIMFLVISA